MKIFVTGASGLLGLNLCLGMEAAHRAIGVDRGKLADTPFELVHAELTEPEAVSRLMDLVRPDAVIHTAALANLELCEANPKLAQTLNADIPGEFAVECVHHGARMIHISTDAVFDGTKDGIYTEIDTPNPQGVYARTKLQGEWNVRFANRDAIIARVNFFGWSLSGTRSLSEFFYNKLAAGQPCNGFADIFFCPLFVGDLARILVRMLDKNLSGLYHVVGSESLSKYEFGIRIARQFGFDPELVRPISVENSGLTAKRSHNLRLSIQKLSTDLGMEIPGVSTGIGQFHTQLQQGYPQKMRSYQQAGN